MEDKPISIRLGARRLTALERYLAANPDETRNGVIAGAIEAHLKATGFWEPTAQDVDDAQDMAPMADRRRTLSERVKALEERVETLMKRRG
jgi:hypothetical protein